MEYIERAAALGICQKEYEERLRMADYCGDTVAWNIGGAIKSLPAAEVVEVVRCCNCCHAWAVSALPGELYCRMIGNTTPPDGYCRRGEGGQHGNEF